MGGLDGCWGGRADMGALRLLIGALLRNSILLHFLSTSMPNSNRPMIPPGQRPFGRYIKTANQQRLGIHDEVGSPPLLNGSSSFIEAKAAAPQQTHW